MWGDSKVRDKFKVLRHENIFMIPFALTLVRVFYFHPWYKELRSKFSGGAHTYAIQILCDYGKYYIFMCFPIFRINFTIKRLSLSMFQASITGEWKFSLMIDLIIFL